MTSATCPDEIAKCYLYILSILIVCSLCSVAYVVDFVLNFQTLSWLHFSKTVIVIEVFSLKISDFQFY